MDRFTEGLRCQDVTLGLRELHPASSHLRLVDNTHLIGMAADLAGLIRGRDIIEKIDSLEVVAGETLDIPALVLPSVLEVLEGAGMVEVDRDRGRVTRILETVPVFRSVYEELGNSWTGRGPRQIEQELVTVVDRLARGPVPLESLTTDLGVEKSDVDTLYRIGVDTSVFKTAETADGVLLYSPYTAFENPRVMREAMVNHGPDELAAMFERVSKYQGLPVSPADPVLQDAVKRGLLAAPGVVLPNGEMRPFAALPYMFDQRLTRERKMVLDKALAVLACIRCGQNYSSGTRAMDPVAVLGALRSRDALRSHPSHARQYKLVRDLGVVRFLPSEWGNDWVRPSLIRTEENLEAMDLAITLVQGDESFSGREQNDDIKVLLGLDARSIKPLQSTARSNSRLVLSDAELGRAFDDLMGRGEL